MGNVPSTVSKSQVATIRANKSVVIDTMKSNTMNNIQQLQTHVIHNMSSSDKSNTSIISANDNMEKILAASFTATRQLNRNSRYFTKDDLIAIILFVQTIQTNTNCFTTMNNYSTLNCDDLIAIIRTIVFNPHTIQKVIELSCNNSPVPLKQQDYNKKIQNTQYSSSNALVIRSR
jgi:hypothetical protein